MLIFLDVINPTNLTNLSDLTSEFRETAIVEQVAFSCDVVIGECFHYSPRSMLYQQSVSDIADLYGYWGDRRLLTAALVMCQPITLYVTVLCCGQRELSFGRGFLN